MYLRKIITIERDLRLQLKDNAPLDEEINDIPANDCLSECIRNVLFSKVRDTQFIETDRERIRVLYLSRKST
jgi:hypothetical protein